MNSDVQFAEIRISRSRFEEVKQAAIESGMTVETVVNNALEEFVALYS
ncbi:MAG TPA: hypothetical protein VJW20_16895 [Candidatus Angelobacter sp.]|nr:hypothetical protein [Candidatus Angelobacter sp.]